MSSIYEESFESCTSGLSRKSDYADYGSTASSIRNSWTTCYESFHEEMGQDQNSSRSYTNPTFYIKPLEENNNDQLPHCSTWVAPSIPRVEFEPAGSSQTSLTDEGAGTDYPAFLLPFTPFPQSKSMNPEDFFTALSKGGRKLSRTTSRRFFPWFSRGSSEDSMEGTEKQHEESGHFWLTSAQRNRLNEQVEKLRDLWTHHTTAMNPFIIRTQEFKHFEQFLERKKDGHNHHDHK